MNDRLLYDRQNLELLLGGHDGCRAGCRIGEAKLNSENSVGKTVGIREEVAVVGAKWREDSKSTPEVECSADRKKAVKRASNEGQMSVGHNVGLLPKAGRTTSHGHPLGPSVIAEVGSEFRVGPSVD